jgi:outer membrane protein TolC
MAMRSNRLFLIVCGFLMLCPLAPPTVAVAQEMTVQRAEAEAWLADFAGRVLAGNREVRASRHEVSLAEQRARRSRADRQPVLSMGEFSGKTANRNYNALTGIDEDYTTRRRGTEVGVAQRTFLGRVGLDVERAKTDFATAQTSYFESMYLSLDRGLTRRDDRLLKLERGIEKLGPAAERARWEVTRLDRLFEGFRVVFETITATKNQAFRQRSLDFYRTLTEEADVKLQHRIGSELDLKQARLRLSQAETGLEESRLVAEEAQRRLELVLGDASAPGDLASVSLAVLASLVPDRLASDSLQEVGERCRPDLCLFAVQEASQARAVRLARERSRPDVRARARWGRQGRGSDPDVAREMRDKSWDVTLSLQTTLGGPRPERIDRRLEVERLAALRLRIQQGRQAARHAITQAGDRLDFHRANLAERRAAAQLSAEVLEGQRLNFQLGKVSLLDLTRYQADHEEASLAVIRAEASLMTAWLGVLYETGTLVTRFHSPHASDPLATEPGAPEAPAGGPLACGSPQAIVSGGPALPSASDLSDSGASSGSKHLGSEALVAPIDSSDLSGSEDSERAAPSASLSPAATVTIVPLDREDLDSLSDHD